MEIVNIIGYVFMVIGGLFYFLGGLGILRMPDVFNRIQAGTKATTLGTFSMLIGVGVSHPEWLLKVILIIIFISISNPIGSSVLAKAAYRTTKLPSNLVQDDLKEFLGGDKDVS
jgi:multicomponent Na+:H+ antiporter subunit G